MVIYDLNELLEASIDLLRCDCAHVRLIQQQPISMLALKNGEVRVEESSNALKVLIRSHCLLDVVGCVDQMVQHLLFDELV